MDAIVTARLAAEKKERGREIMKKLGTSPSRLIGEMYDYVISEGRLPDLTCVSSGITTDMERQKAYADLLKVSVLKVPATFWK